MEEYKRITYEDRVIIEFQLKQGTRPSVIARQLGRSKSTITREIKRNSCSSYRAEVADIHAHASQKRRHTGNRIKDHPLLEYYILLRLRQGWSPEQISHRLKKVKSNNRFMQVSHESIYSYIYLKTKGELRKELISYLRHEKQERKRKVGRASKSLIPDRVGIEHRPEEVTDRIIPGHWESDLVIGADNKSAIGTIVERTTRYVIIVKLKGKGANEVRRRFAEELKDLPCFMRKSLTHDNGLEMAGHKLFSQDVQMQVYFAHPHSPWERGTNENTNMLIRDFFPKGTDFNEIPSGKLKNVQELLNNRPRKILNWSTPNEVFSEYILRGKSGISYPSEVV
jgi:IS30 family transposase